MREFMKKKRADHVLTKKREKKKQDIRNILEKLENKTSTEIENAEGNLKLLNRL